MNNVEVRKKRVSFIIAIVLVLALIIPQMAFALTDADKAEIEDLQDQIADLEKDIASSQSKIEAIEEKKAQSNQTLSDLMVQVNELDTQITNYNKQISLLNASISSLQTQIKDTQDKMVVQEKEIEKSKQALSERMRAMYMAGETSSIEILMSADSFETFLTRMELVQSVAKHDSKLIDDIEKQIEDLKKMETSLREQQVKVQADKDSLSSVRAQLVSKKSTLNVKVAEMNRQINSLNAQDANAKKVQSQLEAQKDAFEQKVDDLLNGKVSTGNGSVGAMIWPLPYRGTYITSPYGYRTMNGVTKFHYGIDISMADKYNKSLVAVADGTVIFASNDGSYNGGYGNYLRIDHGNSVVTVYGHCKTLLVSTGQKVSQGQAVAIMGTSGNSTGVHVHFEVRINNEKKNPLNYLSVPSDVYIKK